MEWKEIGPGCLPVYTKEIQFDLEKRTKIKEEKRAIEDARYKAEEEMEKKHFEEKVKGIEIDLKDADGWKKHREINTSPYGKCAIDYAEGWAKLMQVEIANGKSLVECASKTSFELGFLGITGFMYGCAVSVLSECWRHGDELRKWHNKEYGFSEDKQGVVNPAILTVNI